MKLTRICFASVFLIALVSVAAPGCGTSASDLCKSGCDCQGCSDADLSDCKAVADGIDSCASDLGCGSELDDLVSCIDDNAVCTPGTHPQYTANDACKPEESKYNNCAGACGTLDL